MFLKLIVSLLITSFLFLKPQFVSAKDFLTDYEINYTVSSLKNKLKTKVRLGIKITHLISTKYVKTFSIQFPNSFKITNLKVSDDNGKVLPEVINKRQYTQIKMSFTNPRTGKGTVNNFNLIFNQENLFKKNGNVWEVIIPTVSSKDRNSYRVVVDIPKDSKKKISISKPKPSNISSTDSNWHIVWNNPKTKTIYAVFGEKQFYNLRILYHLKNTKIVPVFTYIAFPIDTTYQKIYLEQINPKPISVKMDKDGNFLGKYFLSPSQNKEIEYKGKVSVYSRPRPEVLIANRKLIGEQKKHLLTDREVWRITPSQKIDALKDTRDLYNFVVNTLSYNYNKVNEKNIRIGASGVLKNPSNAVCLEFSDLFIALAREKGIYSREIEGYGFSQENNLRPLSLANDVLHSWPEYYDSVNKLWVQVDPTWGNTSGIDYFSSFDLNHIAFVVHGDKSNYPVSAGLYKESDSKDVFVKPSSREPIERKKITLEKVMLVKKMNDKNVYDGKIKISNLGNIFQYNLDLDFKSPNIDFYNFSTKEIVALSPGQEKNISFKFRARKQNKKSINRLSILIQGKEYFSDDIVIVPYYYQIASKISILGLGLIFAYLLIKLIRNHYPKKNE